MCHLKEESFQISQSTNHSIFVTAWPPKASDLTLFLALTRVAVEFDLQPESSSILFTGTVELIGQTGVEMWSAPRT